MVSVSIKGLKKKFGDVEVIPDINLEISHGEFVVFVGPSGCGKSTLLRMIAGLEEIDAGEIYFGERRIDQLSPAEREISMVFQSYALYPHMTVRKNMAFGLKMAGAHKERIDARVNKAAAMLQLENLLDRYPRQLSGGQRQRVAIGRAITRDPKVFLFDEPLSNLDASLRLDMRIEIAKLKENLPDATMIYVTHDQVEALTLADRIVVFNKGRIEQVGAPLELYNRPKSKFVASFIGSPSMNFIAGRLQKGNGDSCLEIVNGEKFVLRDSIPEGLVGRPLTVGVRAEHISLNSADPQIAKGAVRHIENLGENIFVYVKVDDGTDIVVKSTPMTLIEKNDLVSLHCRQERLHLFDEHERRVTALEGLAGAFALPAMPRKLEGHSS